MKVTKKDLQGWLIDINNSRFAKHKIGEKRIAALKAGKISIKDMSLIRDALNNDIVKGYISLSIF